MSTEQAIMSISSLPLEFQQLYQDGELLQRDIETHLDLCTKTKPGEESEANKRVEQLRDRAHSWFNKITLHVLPRTTFDRDYTNILLRRLTAAINVTIFHTEYARRLPTRSGDARYITLHNVEQQSDVDDAREETTRVIAQTLRLIRTAATDPIQVDTRSRSGRHVANSAFILMWMDKNHPELEDVHQAVKEVFAEFGIKALRADEIQHQDRITDLILNEIAQSEFLFADLTGERPNVYYEVGYAHALGKRPILYRRANTSLHFDLSIHNVPEYENVTQLRALLRQRLEAITGRVLKRSGDLD